MVRTDDALGTQSVTTGLAVNGQEPSQEPNLLPAPLSTFRGSDDHVRLLVEYVFGAIRDYHKTGSKRSLSSAQESAQEIDALVQQRRTAPKGFFHSAGSGFHIVTPTFLRDWPQSHVYGYLKMPLIDAASSRLAYQHLNNLQQQAANRMPDVFRPAFDNFSRHLYIPTPDRILGEPCLVVPVYDKDDPNLDRAFLFLSLVKGTSLQEQFAQTPSVSVPEGLSKTLNDLRHKQTLVAAQLTGIWEAYPPKLVDAELRSDSAAGPLEARVRHHYLSSGASSLRESLALVGIDESSDIYRDAVNGLAAILKKMVLKTHPFSGNVGAYIDAALENFINETGSLTEDPLQVLRLVTKDGGAIDYHALLDSTRRIDVNVLHRPYCAFEEDLAHITENVYVAASDEQKMQCYATLTLTRMAARYFWEAQKIGEGTPEGKIYLANAVDLADRLEDIRNHRIDPFDVKAFRDYYNEFESTHKILAVWRKIRTGNLVASVYFPKEFAYQSAGLEVPQNSGIDLPSEAVEYFTRAMDGLTSLSESFDVRNASYRPALAVTRALRTISNRIAAGDVSEKILKEKGERYLSGKL